MSAENKRFKITYCGAWGYKQHAVRLAAELESALSEESVLIKSSGGIFEVEDRGQVIFSKAQTHRFPIDGEVVAVVQRLETGQSLSDAQSAAAEKIKPVPSFSDCLAKLLHRNR